jgi:hypothetical protein
MTLTPSPPPLPSQVTSRMYGGAYGGATSPHFQNGCVIRANFSVIVAGAYTTPGCLVIWCLVISRLSLLHELMCRLLERPLAVLVALPDRQM